MNRMHGQRGAALIEVAVILPLLMLLAIGAVEFGRYANYAIVVANAAHAGVQYGAQSLATASDTTGMQNAALADASNLSTLTAVASHYCQCSNGTSSNCLSSDCPLPSHRLLWVKVTVTGTETSLLSYPGIPQSFKISQTAIMRVDQ